jgi:hypothetical protein
MPAKQIATGIAGSVFVLGAVTLVPLIIGAALLAVAAMFRDVGALIHRIHFKGG